MYNLVKAFSLLYEVSFTVVLIFPESKVLQDQNQAVYIYSNVTDVIEMIRHDLEYKRWTLIFVYRKLTQDEVLQLTHAAHWLPLSRWIFFGDKLEDFGRMRSAWLAKCISCAHNPDHNLLDIPSKYRDCERRTNVNLTSEDASIRLREMNRIDRLIVVCRSICWDFDEFQEIIRSLTNHSAEKLLVNLNQPVQQESEEVFFKLRSRQGDVVLARHVFSEDRLGQVGYSTVSSFSQNYFITKRTPRHRMGSFGLINIFDKYCWFTLVATAMAFTFILNLNIHNAAYSALQVLGCLLQVGIVIHKRRNSILYITMLLGSILIAQVFRTKLLSSFNIPSHRTLNTVADFVAVLEQGKVRVCVFEKDFISSLITAEANLHVLRLLAEAKRNRKLYQRTQEACIRFTARNENVITILSSAEIYTANYSHLVDISAQAVAERVSGFLISPGHPLANKFNQIVLQMLDMDMFTRIKQRKLLRWKIKTLLRQTHSTYINQLNVWDVAMGLLILAAGLFMACIEFCIEYGTNVYVRITPIDYDP